MSDRDKPIKFSDVSLAKEFRYLSRGRMKELIRDKKWIEKDEIDMYKVRGKSTSTFQPDLTVTVVFRVLDEKIIVITQKKKGHENK